MSSKILKELPKLVQEQVITPETAQAIEHYYQSRPDTKTNSLLTIFGVLGAILVGLGIILIFAHNWDNFPKGVKVFLAFLPLLISQFFTGYAILQKKSAVWKEITGTFLFFSVGTAIALISQIYHIPGDLGNYLFTWTLLCLPLIYLLKSNALALLHLVFTTYYGAVAGYSDGSYPWFYLVFILLFLPHYYQLCKEHAGGNITAVFHWLLPFSFTITLGTFFSSSSQLGFLMYMTLFGLFYNTGKLSFLKAHSLIKNGYLLIGTIGTTILAIVLSSKWFWTNYYFEKDFNYKDFGLLVLLQCAAAGILWLTVKQQKSYKEVNGFQLIFLVFSGIFLLGLAHSIAGIVLTNLLVLLMGAYMVKIGATRFNFTILNYGLLIITTLIICRFFDTNMSFIIRGLLFILVGAGFFSANYLLLQKTKK